MLILCKVRQFWIRIESEVHSEERTWPDSCTEAQELSEVRGEAVRVAKTAVQSQHSSCWKRPMAGRDKLERKCSCTNWSWCWDRHVLKQVLCNFHLELHYNIDFPFLHLSMMSKAGRSPSCVTFVLTNTEAEEAPPQRSIVSHPRPAPPSLPLAHSLCPTRPHNLLPLRWEHMIKHYLGGLSLQQIEFVQGHDASTGCVLNFF